MSTDLSAEAMFAYDYVRDMITECGEAPTLNRIGQWRRYSSGPGGVLRGLAGALMTRPSPCWRGRSGPESARRQRSYRRG